MKQNIKVALVHDSLVEYGGAERVLWALCQVFPQAPIYTAFYCPQNLGQAAAWLQQKDIRSTYLAKIPGHCRYRSPLRLLAPHAFSRLDLRDFELIISSVNSYHAKAVRPAPGAVHLCYCHTPARSLYGYDTSSDWRSHQLTHFFGSLINHYLRLVDFATAQQPTAMIANSKVTAARIKKFYRRESVIIYPPVVLPPVKNPPSKRSYYLYVNRLTYAKHPEIAVQACLDLALPLKVVGQGAMLPHLQKIAAASSQIEFLGDVSDAKLATLYAGAKALLYPVIDEDLGLVPLEAMSLGTPVIAHYSGGPKETIVAGKSGLFFKQLSSAGLKQALERFGNMSFNPNVVQQQVSKYTLKNFRQEILALVKRARSQV